MSDYVFIVGNDYVHNNKEYVSINSDKGQQISICSVLYHFYSVAYQAHFSSSFICFLLRYSQMFLYQPPQISYFSAVRLSYD